VMRNPNADWAGRDVHLSSPAPGSVPPGYHKILRSVKEPNRPHDLGGRWAATRSAGKMIVTLGGEPCRVWIITMRCNLAPFDKTMPQWSGQTDPGALSQLGVDLEGPAEMLQAFPNAKQAKASLAPFTRDDFPRINLCRS
jgi:hypothetical protein